MRDEDAEQWEGQFEAWDADCWGPAPGEDCASGWWSGRAAAGRLNYALAQCGFELWEVEATGGMLEDGRGTVRVVGSPLAVRRLARLLGQVNRQAPPGSAEGERGAA
ncbi:hypothetical protein [Streptacidiphilus sp. PAMC 29251]